MQKISVILPVYNGGTYLKLSIQSVLNQDSKNLELLILDDCSNDGSREYLDELLDERIVYFKNDINKGLFYNLNFLIGKSTTNLIKLWAQDDIMYPNCLSTIILFHNAHPAISFSYSGRTIIDENGTIIPNFGVDNTPEIITFDLHARIAFYTGSIAGNIANVCINKEKLDMVGSFDKNMKISGDFDMWVRLSKVGNVGRITQEIIYLRDHKGQLSRKSEYLLFHVKEDMKVYNKLLGICNDSLSDEGLELLRKYKFVFYYTLMTKSFIKGDLKMSQSYYKLLQPYTNFFKQYYYWFTAKFIKNTKPAFLDFPN